MFVSCGPFCVTATYCKKVAETILSDVIGVLVSVAKIAATAGAAAADPFTIISLVGKIISIMQKILHHKCPSEDSVTLREDWAKYKTAANTHFAKLKDGVASDARYLLGFDPIENDDRPFMWPNEDESESASLLQGREASDGPRNVSSL